MAHKKSTCGVEINSMNQQQPISEEMSGEEEGIR